MHPYSVHFDMKFRFQRENTQEDNGDDWPCQCDKDATVNLSAQFLQIFLQERMRQKQKLTIPQLICYSRCLVRKTG